ncbi:MAG: hypothetical protein AAF266_09540 [Planctomycetota bacterium]
MLLVAVGSTMLVGMLGYFKGGVMSGVQDKVTICLSGETAEWGREPTSRIDGISIEPRRSLPSSSMDSGGRSPNTSAESQNGGSPALQGLSDAELRGLRMTDPNDLEKLKKLRVPGADLLTLTEVAAEVASERGDFVGGVAKNVHGPLSKANLVMGAYNGMIDAYRFQRDPNLDTGSDFVSSGVGLAGSVAGSPHLMVASAGFNIGKTAGGFIMGTERVGVFFLTKLGFPEAVAREAVKMTAGN